MLYNMSYWDFPQIFTFLLTLAYLLYNMLCMVLHMYK